MLDPDGLNVWSDRQLVGYLWRNSQGLIGFRYEAQWLAQGEFAISHTLALRQEDYAPEEGMLLQPYMAAPLPNHNPTITFQRLDNDIVIQAGYLAHSAMSKYSASGAKL